MAGSTSLYSISAVFCVAVLLKAWRKYRVRAGLPLPPGPTGLPLIGSVLDIDAERPWLSYEKWGKQYGGLVYVNLLGRDFIVINSVEVAHDLLEQRSAVYSDRPYIPANELFGMDFNSGLLPYGETWRLHRRMYNAALNKDQASQYKPLALSKACQFTENLLDTPEDYAMHCKTFSAATIMAAVYDYEVAPQNDLFVTKVEQLIELFTAAMTPERAALLLAFPFLAHLPSWMPGGEYKQRAAECRALAKEVLNNPVDYVLDNMAVGIAKESIVRSLLETSHGEAQEEAVKGVATSAFLGSADTTDSTVKTFLLAMVLHPEVQLRAQEEIDRVVGNRHLPDFGDRSNLPYVEAVYREVLRWRPAVASALPRMTVTSDIYEGMYIPKGAIVLTNVWAMTHDETRFDDPMAFIPERHLSPDGILPKGTLPNFGFGRRNCPGRFFAEQNIWAAIVIILATLNLSKARDEFGNEIEVKEEFTGGLSSAPKPFLCSITARTSCAEDLIRTQNGDAH